ncbi:MAG: hypothetical protein RL616_1279 [Verrucomicrobiota bacterium]
MMLAPTLAFNGAKVPYRNHERYEALIAYANDRTAENKALMEEEVRKVDRYVTHQWLVRTGIPFAALLLFEGVFFYYFFWHKKSQKPQA